MVQLGLALPAPKCGHGGARKGAGRKKRPDGGKDPHNKREHFATRFPVQVTLKVCPDVVNLRRHDVFSKIKAALQTGAQRDDGKVCDFCISSSTLRTIRR